MMQYIEDREGIRYIQGGWILENKVEGDKLGIIGNKDIWEVLGLE